MEPHFRERDEGGCSVLRELAKMVEVLESIVLILSQRELSPPFEACRESTGVGLASDLEECYCYRGEVTI